MRGNHHAAHSPWIGLSPADALDLSFFEQRASNFACIATGMSPISSREKCSAVGLFEFAQVA